MTESNYNRGDYEKTWRQAIFARVDVLTRPAASDARTIHKIKSALEKRMKDKPTFTTDDVDDFVGERLQEPRPAKKERESPSGVRSAANGRSTDLSAVAG